MMEAEGGKVLLWKAKGVWKRREGWGGEWREKTGNDSRGLPQMQ